MGPLDPHGPRCGAPAAPPSRGAWACLRRSNFCASTDDTICNSTDVFKAPSVVHNVTITLFPFTLSLHYSLGLSFLPLGLRTLLLLIPLF